jgi:hypothetical protein
VARREVPEDFLRSSGALVHIGVVPSALRRAEGTALAVSPGGAGDGKKIICEDEQG